MEDRYLFKAKRIDNGEWVIGNLITNVFFRLGQSIPYILCSDKAEYDCFEDFTEGNGIFEVRPDTICRCTGSKDKNGKLIWENDIVGYYDKYVGKWCYGLVGYGEFNCSCCNGVYGWHFGDEDIREYKGYEVKGNKFDNPELLEA